MIRHLAILLALAVVTGTGASAQDHETSRDFAGDRFLSGTAPDSSTAVPGDLFAVGERVDVGGAVDGAAHLAARRISLTAPVGDDLYAAGMDVRVAAPVESAATVAGYDVEVAAPVGGNLRAFGRHLVIGSEVGGSLIAAAQQLELSGTVAGDADLTVDDISFGPGASVAGTLTLRGITEEDAAVPDGLAAEIRYLELPPGAEGFGSPEAVELPGLGEIVLAAVVAFVVGVLIVAALALAAASLAPMRVEDAVERSFIAPGGTLWAGILTLSLILGGALVLALTGIGALALPLIFFAAFLLAAAGYVVGAYAIGARILRGEARGAPDSVGPRAGAALIGAALVALLAIIPFAGWLIVLAVAMFGLGIILPATAQMGESAAG
ncbi:MAG: hypothetical protein V2I65_14220 [Paracoccaceae bacterium]|jgi:hypothetical protein|nr:hypothetical protein [Paracoccaceae bacterium]